MAVEFASLPRETANKHIFVYAAIAALGVALGAYAIHEHRAAQNLSQQNVQTTAELTGTRHQLSDLSAKVDMLAARETQAAQSTASAQATPTRRPSAAHRLKEDPRFNKLQSQIDAQGKAIDQTRSELSGAEGDLANTRTELSGNIAHTHDELVLLEKKGERNYAEFDLPKAKEFKREGPLSLRLKKANTRHQYADLDLIVDDRNLSQKHVNLYQPVMFSTPDSPQPVQIVINSITDDHIHGYVSAPKYRQSELTATSNTPQNPAQNSNQQPANSSGEPTLKQRTQ